MFDNSAQGRQMTDAVDKAAALSSIFSIFTAVMSWLGAHVSQIQIWLSVLLTVILIVKYTRELIRGHNRN